jgi:hypothetical protein
MMPSIAEMCLGNFTPSASIELARVVCRDLEYHDGPAIRVVAWPSLDTPREPAGERRERWRRELRALHPERFFLADVKALGMAHSHASDLVKLWRKQGFVRKLRFLKVSGAVRPRLAFEWCK